MLQKIWAYFGDLLRKLLELRDSPHAIAGGVACGIFFGVTPLFGFKTVTSIAAAWLTRCSKLAALIAVSLTDIMTPFWPFILRIQYDIGYWLLSNPHRFPPAFNAGDIKLGELFRWQTFHEIGLPMILGGMIIGAPIAAIFYVITYVSLKNRPLKPLITKE